MKGNQRQSSFRHKKVQRLWKYDTYTTEFIDYTVRCYQSIPQTLVNLPSGASTLISSRPLIQPIPSCVVYRKSRSSTSQRIPNCLIAYQVNFLQVTGTFRYYLAIALDLRRRIRWCLLLSRLWFYLRHPRLLYLRQIQHSTKGSE